MGVKKDSFIALIPLVLGAVAGLWIGGNVGLLTEASNSRYLLSGLIQSIAAIVGIVFSVMLLATQFIGSKYSLSLRNIVLNSKYFYLSLIAFLSLFLVDITLLFILSEPLTLQYQTALIVTTFAHFSFLYLLLCFVQDTLYRISPKGITETFKEDYIGSKFVEKVENHGDNPSNIIMPFILDSIQDMDRNSANKGLVSLRSVCIEALEYKTTQPFFGYAFKPVLTEKLPLITLEAKKHRAEDVVETSLYTIEEISSYNTSANWSNRGKLLIYGLNGFFEIIESSEEFGYDELISDSGEKMAELLQYTEEINADSGERLIEEFGKNAGETLLICRDEYIRESLASKFTSRLSDSICTRIEKADTLPGEVDFNHEPSHEISLAKASAEVNNTKIIYSGLEAFREIYRQVLFYFRRNKFDPIWIRNISEDFEQVCIESAKNSSKLTKSFVQDYIVLAALTLEASENVNIDYWVNALQNIDSSSEGNEVPEVLTKMSEDGLIPENWGSTMKSITNASKYMETLSKIETEFNQVEEID